MQIRKKCVQCNTLNDESLAFCSNCGNYLKGKVVTKEKKISIWGVDQTPAKVIKDSLKISTKPSNTLRKYVVCPECLTESNTPNNVLPLSCSACGYFFQAGIDRIVDSTVLKSQHKTVSDVSKDEKEDNKSHRSPLHRAKKDNSSLRINMISSNNVLPQTMKESGNIIGYHGTVFKTFQSEKQIFIWHEESGWYVRNTIGTVLFNGTPMNLGVEKRLSTGIILEIDQEQFSTEIIK